MKYLLVFSLSFTGLAGFSQDVLRDYINTGLENNLALKQKEINYRQSLEALKEAKGLFYPSVSVNARYTVSEGGRVIDFPAGDMLNGVYAALNEMLDPDRFPQIENQEIRFLRPAEHETKLRLAQPVFNTDIYYNSKIKKGLAISEEINLEQYKRELVVEIKKAYYSVGMTTSVLTMLQETRLLLLENIRVNEKLVENSKITYDNLLRSRTELSKFEQQLLVAEKNRQVAQAYFNFLLNRSLNDSIVIETPDDLPVISSIQGDYAQLAVNNREEIRNLENYRQISDMNVKLNRSAALPNLLLVADYGFQGEKYIFNKNQDYLQASLVLSWDLFTGFQKKSKVSQAFLQKGLIDNQLEEAKSRVGLQVINAYNELKASDAALKAAEDQVLSSREAFRLLKRKYEEGQASLIEFIDARNTLTQAEENRIISHYTYRLNYAEFEKVIAINNPK